ncbi:MAG: hypothetical protein KatS3mg109_1842 [Pirellulaceae bacterium]|nr:MAG: hypothetical protein KatS3mg109_1842 [Pirellulaceae bacterium]GIW95416.1 MAG: hypothetical protein KatS3mg110_3457 [Pirellulaceae bacterium]
MNDPQSIHQADDNPAQDFQHADAPESRPAAPDPSMNQTPAPAVLDFDQLAGPNNEVLIRLGAAVYRLRRTRNGRLLLYK